MLIIGYFKPRKEAFELQYTKQVSIEPYKYVKQVGLTIVVIVVGIYIYFAK
jgi:SSS family solute:Na+ symporter